MFSQSYNKDVFIKRKRGCTCCDSVGFRLGRGGKFSGPFCRRLGLSVQCGFKDGLGGVQLFDQTWEFVLKDGVRTVSGTVIAVIGLDDEDDDDGEESDVGKDDENEDDAEDGFCFVTNAGSVVTCQ